MTIRIKSILDACTSSATGFLEKQKQSIYISSTLIMVIGTIINLIGLMGPVSGIFTWLNTAILSITIILYVCYSCKLLSLNISLTMFLVATQLELIGEMVYAALYPTAYHINLILADLMLSTVVAMLALLAYLRYLPCILSFSVIVTCTVCTLMTGDSSMKNFIGVVILVFLIICFLGTYLVSNLYLLNEENNILKSDEAELLRILRLNKAEIKAYIELSKQKKLSASRVNELLLLIGERSQRNIIETVSTYIKQQNTEKEIMKEAFPELTESEREICSLILQGKKQGEICSILNKTETNINSQRAHIRKKLNLQPKDNLYKELEEKMKLYKLKR